MKTWWRILTLGSFFIVCAIVIFVQTGYTDQMYGLGDTIPRHPVALVLGASLVSGKPSAMLADRLDTAAILYKEGIVKKLIVSGDNRREDYNEPQTMKAYLIERGIPDLDVIPDYAGRRTYDSCFRLKEIFSQTSTVIITQRFHLSRALYLCDQLGVDSVGVIADKSHYQSLAGAYIREFFASVKAFLDIALIKPTPILGNKEPVF